MGPDPAAAPPSPFFSPAVLPATLVATCIPATLSLSLFLSSLSRTRLTLADAVRWQSRISLVVLFPIAASVRCRVLPYLRPPPSPLPFFLRRRYPPARTYLPTYTGALSVHTLSFSLPPFLEALFLLGDKCKTKTYLPYSLCKYTGTATQGGPEFFLRFRSRFPRHASHLLHVSPAVVYSTIFAILLTIIRIRRSANGYGRGGMSYGCNWDGLFYFSAIDC